MKMSRHCFCALFLVLLILGSTQVSGCFAAADTEDEDAQAYLKKAIGAMSSLHSYRVEMAVDAILPTAGVNVTSEREFFMQPTFISRTSSVMLIYDLKGAWKEVPARSYAKRLGRQFTEYTNIGDLWTKRTVPYVDAGLYDEGRMFLTHIKKVKIREQRGETVLIDVTADGKTVGRNMINILRKQFPIQMRVLRAAFHFDDDITYTIGINRRTGYLTRLDMDLSDAVKLNLADILEHPESVGMQMDAEERQKCRLMLNDLRFIVQMMVSQYNEVEKFGISVESMKAVTAAETVNPKRQ